MLEKIKGMKGLLFRKMKEARTVKEVELPGFSIEKPKKLIDIETVKDITKINIT